MASVKSPAVDLAAAAVADGSMIDWDHVKAGADNADRRRIEQLEVIAMIGQNHQTRAVTTRSSRALRSHVQDTTKRPAPDHPDNVGRWGDLILIEEVGDGTFGTVYRAHDPKLDRPVAVKLLKRSAYSDDERLESRLLHEAQTLASVSHPNVVKIYSVGKHDGRLGLEMEFVRGLTLEEMLASHGPFSAAEAVLIGYELCGALAAVHHKDLIHRDVKAQNVMREEGGRLVLMDFGAGQRRSRPFSMRNRLVGTPLYLAPEVLTGNEATISSDIYSLGVMLFHLVTNDFPVKGTTLVEIVKAHARGQVEALEHLRPGLKKSFVHLVKRAIAHSPADRFATVHEFQESLAQLHASDVQGVLAPRVRTTVRLRGYRRPNAPSIAVLPFTDMSPAKDEEYFCDGMTEELINALTRISGLRVAARTSTFQFKGQARDVRQIGEALNVATILDGSVRKDRDRLRITVELIGASDGYHLWSERFDRSLVDVFSIQDEIASSIVEKLKGTADRYSIVAPRSQNLHAYEAYLEGRYHWNKRTEGALNKSVKCFERAIRHDPQYAPAYAGMADAYLTLGTYGALPPKDVRRSAANAVKAALRIDDSSAEVYTCRGCLRAVYNWAWADAEQDFRRAMALKPSYPTAHHWFAINHLVPVRRFDEATEQLRIALQLDPLALAIKTSVGMKSYFAGRLEQAAKELSNTIELDDSFGMAHFFLGAVYTEQGLFGEARKELDAAIRFSGRSPEILAALGYLHGRKGNVRSARQILAELKQIAAFHYVSPAKIAQVHIGVGEPELALKLLEEAFANRAADLAWLGVHPAFGDLRGEPRFDVLLRKMALSGSKK